MLSYLALPNVIVLYWDLICVQESERQAKCHWIKSVISFAALYTSRDCARSESERNDGVFGRVRKGGEGVAERDWDLDREGGERESDRWWQEKCRKRIECHSAGGWWSEGRRGDQRTTGPVKQIITSLHQCLASSTSVPLDTSSSISSEDLTVPSSLGLLKLSRLFGIGVPVQDEVVEDSAIVF